MKFPLLNSKFPLYFTFLPKQLSITVPVLALQLELISKLRDFPGGPVVKTSPSSIGDENLIPGQEAKIPQASRPKNQKHQNRSNIWTKSIKIFKMIHIKKILKKNNMCMCMLSHVQPFVDCSPAGSSPSKNTGVGCRFLLRGIFLNQKSTSHLLH